jgi:hypothetical protein
LKAQNSTKIRKAAHYQPSVIPGGKRFVCETQMPMDVANFIQSYVYVKDFER